MVTCINQIKFCFKTVNLIYICTNLRCLIMKIDISCYLATGIYIIILRVDSCQFAISLRTVRMALPQMILLADSDETRKII